MLERLHHVAAKCVQNEQQHWAQNNRVKAVGYACAARVLSVALVILQALVLVFAPMGAAIEIGIYALRNRSKPFFQRDFSNFIKMEKAFLKTYALGFAISISSITAAEILYGNIKLQKNLYEYSIKFEFGLYQVGLKELSKNDRESWNKTAKLLDLTEDSNKQFDNLLWSTWEKNALKHNEKSKIGSPVIESTFKASFLEAKKEFVKQNLEAMSPERLALAREKHKAELNSLLDVDPVIGNSLEQEQVDLLNYISTLYPEPEEEQVNEENPVPPSQSNTLSQQEKDKRMAQELEDEAFARKLLDEDINGVNADLLRRLIMSPAAPPSRRSSRTLQPNPSANAAGVIHQPFRSSGEARIKDAVDSHPQIPANLLQHFQPINGNLSANQVAGIRNLLALAYAMERGARFGLAVAPEDAGISEGVARSVALLQPKTLTDAEKKFAEKLISCMDEAGKELQCKDYFAEISAADNDCYVATIRFGVYKLLSPRNQNKGITPLWIPVKHIPPDYTQEEIARMSDEDKITAKGKNENNKRERTELEAATAKVKKLQLDLIKDIKEFELRRDDKADELLLMLIANTPTDTEIQKIKAEVEADGKANPQKYENKGMKVETAKEQEVTKRISAYKSKKEHDFKAECQESMDVRKQKTYVLMKRIYQGVVTLAGEIQSLLNKFSINKDNKEFDLGIKAVFGDKSAEQELEALKKKKETAK
jgi:hypothetical protein